jgi:ArsR family transcriptional regulator
MQNFAGMQLCEPAVNRNAMAGKTSQKLKSRHQLSHFKAEFFKALAHPLRISILDALREGELTVNEISQRFEVEGANASQQLAILRNRNIVIAQKVGTNVYYSVSDKTIFKLLDAARDIFNNHLVGVRDM